jgi:hypothetical protein
VIVSAFAEALEAAGGPLLFVAAMALLSLREDDAQKWSAFVGDDIIIFTIESKGFFAVSVGCKESSTANVLPSTRPLPIASLADMLSNLALTETSAVGDASIAVPPSTPTPLVQLA